MIRNRFIGLAVSLLVFGFTLSGHADEPCGGIKIQGGMVVLGQPLNSDFIGKDAGRRCLSSVAALLVRNRLIRAVTVSYRADDAVRMDGTALSVARKVADLLVRAGLPQNRVFAVAPSVPSGQNASLTIHYTERAPDSVVARIAKLSGAVSIGFSETALRPAEPSMPILVEDLLRTGPEGVAEVELRDGSGIRIKKESQVRFVKLDFAESGERSVRIEVQRGQIEATVKKAAAGSSFDTSSRIAVASARGTSFRFGNTTDGKSKLETLTGQVALGPETHGNPMLVDAGFGSRVDQAGVVEKPTPLPQIPRVIAPLVGTLPKDESLSFAAVPSAVFYRVELARDPDFLVEASETEVPQPRLHLSPRPPVGKWFWRVSAVNAAGFASASSPVYSFSVLP